MRFIRVCLIITAVVLFSGQAVSATSSIKDFTKGMQHEAGFFDVYFDRDSGKAYLAVNKLNQDFLLLTSLPYGLGSNDIGLDRGLQGGSRLVYFDRVGETLFLNQRNLDYRATSDNLAERQSIREAFAESRLAAFPIKAKTKSSFLVDVTEVALADWMGVAERIKRRQQGQFGLNNALSSLDPNVIKAFPLNTEVQSILTFSGKNPGRALRSVAPDDNHFTVRQRLSFVALPDDNYQPRVFHPRSGFWSRDYLDFSSPLGADMTQRFIPRHRLNKKDPNAEMSEPVEPIVYYVDSGTPDLIREALIDGGLWWNQAFESAGYKNAFQIKVLPEGADAMDIRYNVIQWVHRSTRGWSYGASVVDPRTGEIIKGHVTLGSLRVRQDLLIANGLTAPFGANEDIAKQKAMALDRIRQLSAHEIGHTLGIAHNFAASANERASVMDYPHPLVSIENGKVVFTEAYDKGIGLWDRQVVKYGYSDFSTTDETLALQNIILENEKLGLDFISDQDARPVGGVHPTAHLWDNGKDAITELKRLIDIRSLALSNFSEKVLPKGMPYSQLEEVLVPIYNLHRYQVEAVAKLVGGVDYQYSLIGFDKPGMQHLPKETQQAAVDSLMLTLSPAFLNLSENIISLIPPKAYGYAKTRESFNGKTGLLLDKFSIAQASAAHTLNYLLNGSRITRLAQQDSENNLSLSELLAQMTKAILKSQYELADQELIARRVAHSYLLRLKQVQLDQATPIEVSSVVNSEIAAIEKWLNSNLGRTRVTSDKYGFYQTLLGVIELDEVKLPLSNEPDLPPGSPIG